MTSHARSLLEHVHRLAQVYHWNERDTLQLPLWRRIAYLALIESQEDAALLARTQQEL